MYLTTEERTGILLEFIRDAEQLLDESQDAATLLRSLIVIAKRHPKWKDAIKPHIAPISSEAQNLDAPCSDCGIPTSKHSIDQTSGPVCPQKPDEFRDTDSGLPPVSRSEADERNNDDIPF